MLNVNSLLLPGWVDDNVYMNMGTEGGVTANTCGV